MKIKINKATDHGAWYAKRIGQVLEVEHVEINRRPDQGIPEDVYWCRTGDEFNTLNYVRRSDATEILPRGVSIIPYRNGQFSISKRLSPSDKCAGLWQFPGGRIEDGEEPRSAARREFFEETGLDLPEDRFIFIAESAPLIGYKDERYIGYRFGIVLREDEHLSNPEPHKHTAWVWVAAEELRNYMMLFGIMPYAFDFQRLVVDGQS